MVEVRHQPAASVVPFDDGDGLLRVLTALAHPHRLRIVEAIAGGRNYVSQLARDLQIGRPLLHMHLQRLEAAGLVRSSMEISEDGKAMRYVATTPFALHLTPEVVAIAVRAGLNTGTSQDS
jgi:DNA-binding transcriptional ArsR family regulator